MKDEGKNQSPPERKANEVFSTPDEFAFLHAAVNPESINRWIFLDDYPLTKTHELFDWVKSLWGDHCFWLPLEECEERNLFSGPRLSNNRSLLLVDAQHHADKSHIQSTLKRFLTKQPAYTLLVLGNGCLSQVRLGSLYGRGEHFSFPDFQEVTSNFSRNDELLLRHSRKLIPKYSLSQLIINSRSRRKLLESVDYIRTKHHCETTWGFQEFHSRGHGVTLLFHGPSGTGKTMACEAIAKEVGLPIYQVDLSSVMSKWVGETEKNLKSIFRAARGVGGILLFDEGDAIFGPRTKVEGSQDRYANLEVNYLLQEIEAFDGITILSTNHEKNTDPAFLRRFTSTVNFGIPNAEMRHQIWKVNIPPELPLDDEVDFKHLSTVVLTGGEIRNCIRDAAAIAAAKKQSSVFHIDFLWAVRRELQKQGMDLSREQLGDAYWRVVGREWEHIHFRRGQRYPKVTPLNHTRETHEHA